MERAVALARRVEDNTYHLHCLLQDFNIEDSFMPTGAQMWEAHFANPNPDWQHKVPAPTFDEIRFSDAFRALTIAERASALGYIDGCWSPEDEDDG